ncbi:MAG: hypothetical protein KC422_14275 [Trueperaceae bacterium]|nr:hypothetical protein [Trueperaceae bacterium]
MKRISLLLSFTVLVLAACSQTPAPEPAVLDAPANFEAVPGEASISLSWDAVTDADSYVLEKSTDGATFSELQNTPGTSYADAEVVAGIEYTYRVFAKNAQTESDKVTTTASLIASTCGPLAQEAEDGELNGAFVIETDVADGNASGGKYVHIPDNDKPGTVKDSMTAPDPDNYVSFCFKVDTAGDYMIKTFVAGNDDSDDSFWVIVDDNKIITYTFSDIIRRTPNPFPAFTEDYVKDQGVGDVTLTLAAGEHVIRFHHRESDSRLDKLELELKAAN